MFKSKPQIFVENLVQSLLSLLKIIVFSKRTGNYKKDIEATGECIIAGNGPSLNDSIKSRPDFFASKHIFAVNHFANSEYYTQFKPAFYVLNAPEMWDENADEVFRQSGEKLFGNLAQKTDWSLYLFVNSHARKFRKWRQIISTNPGIEIRFFNAAPIEGFPAFERFCYRYNLGMPRPHNVLIPALVIALNLSFDKLYVAGADHNWMKDLYVSDDNRVYLTQKHFYDEKTAKQNTMHKRGKGQRKMHEILQKFAHSFESYFKINAFAEKAGKQIINITPGSFIDAFERERNDP